MQRLHILWDPIVCALAERTSTVSYIWSDVGSIEPKHVAEFLIFFRNICCVID